MTVDHQTWAEEQMQALLGLGIIIEDAELVIGWVLTHLPADADPDTWIPPPDLLDEPLEDSSHIE